MAKGNRQSTELSRQVDLVKRVSWKLAAELKHASQTPNFKPVVMGRLFRFELTVTATTANLFKPRKLKLH